MIKRRLSQAFVVLRIYFFKVVFFFFRKRAKNYYLISERGDDARDNGLALYLFLKKNHPEIPIKYVIKNDSEDFGRIATEDVVFRGTKKHYFFFLYADYLVSTHLMGFSPEINVCMKLNSKKMLPIHGKTIFLQHGITKDYSKLFDYSFTRLSLFCCAADKERDFIKEANHYPENIIKSLGFCRFDSLHDESNSEAKRILVMPTWRHWHSTLSDEDFKKTTFFKVYQTLLNDTALEEYFEKNGIELFFYVHYETQRFASLFKSRSLRFHICKKEEYDVQSLLKKCDCLITDYSSVYFDFAYMQKKVIYFHFDYEKYRQTHPEGYFSYLNDGFGPICKTLEEIRAEILSGFSMTEFYKDRVRSFFTFCDSSNSERTFEAMAALRK